MKTTKCIACVVMAFFFYGCISHSQKMGEIDILNYPTGQIMMITTDILDHTDKSLGFRLVSYTKDGTQICDGIWKWKVQEGNVIDIKNGTFWLFEYKSTTIGHYKDGKLVLTTDLGDKPVDISKLKKKTNQELMREGLLAGFSVEIK